MYERVNRDSLKTKEKCYKVAEGYIKEGKSLVIDNTNPKK
jgi:bifunctional polynucleotide phosphatase/kinase